MRGHLDHHGVEHINLLVGTHPHADHIGQFDTVLRGWRVRPDPDAQYRRVGDPLSAHRADDP